MQLKGLSAIGPDTVKEYVAEDVSKERNFSEEPKSPEVGSHCTAYSPIPKN